MENKNRKSEIVTLGILLALVLGLGVVIGLQFTTDYQSAGANSFNRFTEVETSSSVTVASSTSTEILGKNTGRIYAAIVNDGDTDVYLSLGGTAVAGEGIRLNANGGTYEINPDNLFIGAVNGIATSSPSSVTIIEQ